MKSPCKGRASTALGAAGAREQPADQGQVLARHDGVTGY